MKCTNCGEELKTDDKYCTNCGHQTEEKKEISQDNTISQFDSQRKKSNTGLIVGLIALGIIAVISVLAVIGMKTEKGQESPSTQNTPTTQETQNTDNTDVSNSKTSKTVDFNGYTFNVPADCTASATGNQLFIYGPSSKWVAVVMMQQGSYDTLVAMKEQIKTALSAQEGAENYDINSAITEEKNYGGKSFLITSNIKSGTYNLDISYGKADDSNVYVISVTKSNSTSITEEERNEIYSIVASGQKNA